MVRENIFARTRAIIRANLPQFEAWVHAQGDVFTYARPVAGAIGYVKYDLPVGSTELVDRVRAERSVLLVPGDMFGLGKGVRYGFGFDIEHTMKGLAQSGGSAHRPPAVTVVRRCGWAPLEDPAYLAYHDEEWGVPLHDDVAAVRDADAGGRAGRPVVGDDPAQARGIPAGVRRIRPREGRPLRRPEGRTAACRIRRSSATA